MKMLAAYTASLVVFTGIDFIWLGRMGDSFYRPAMGGLAMDGFRLGPAVAFYLLYAFGVVFFAVNPALAAQNWKMAAGYGLALGLIGYGVYDLTNQATLKTWPLTLTLVDMAWGSFLTGLAALAGYVAGRLA
ncbi:DUF2177 family protein [Rhodoblastus acidophilus]|uniref:DUF2177 family protein n=1 Tax=Candidatus Rhodoblastus alkanivorans TaxID=2954117 RepID=A0ABS9Z981_9HYPH|nr:DUF2177 family protein [Candidatus Rhodoblastus alkanivorans]MCI4678353.1 DUF2177 family protein [Candidatus Rhodoblastus alkanivorans]MCI4683611.1 DUF2177 family protein [Candidatus Rhodoblastus alkanivorans]MDI4640927.1 DUF2177 family protein [Rhodoblastus acidophilus]